jgi:hypothetical protein
MKTMNKKMLWLAPLFVTVACASAPAPTQAQTPTVKESQDTIPVGLGTLKQDEFTMGLRSGALLVKVTPMHESVIRLAAPDTYNRLRSLRVSREKDAVARSNSENPEIFLVSFFSYEPDAIFQPEDVQIEHQGRLLRASAILPLSPNWGKGRLSQQEIATGVYVFSDAINYEMPIVVRYGSNDNSDWQRIIPKLQVERGRVTGRGKQ